MKFLFLSMFFIVSAKAQQPAFQYTSLLGDSIFVNFKSADSVPIERVKHLIISCDKLDSINHNIIKFRGIHLVTYYNIPVT